jgi:hypothetical protein
MSGYPATERRTRPRQGASLTTHGLSLEELALLLEIAPDGWTEDEALGVVRRVAAQVCSIIGDREGGQGREAARWRLLASADEPTIRAFLKDVRAPAPKSPGDRMIARLAEMLRRDLDGLHRTQSHAAPRPFDS